MSMGEETVIDAPVTPAPVFAYRALKAVFWGEDQTPEQVPRKSEVEFNQPQESTEQSNCTGKGSLVLLTPSNKRKFSTIAQPSPTKSILRAPGAHTPRRALLKDLNVTFKDLRKSISPELMVKAVVRVEDDKENRPFLRTTTADSKTKELFAVAETSTRGQPEKAALNKNVAGSDRKGKQDIVSAAGARTPEPVAASPSVTTTFDAEAYMRSTEKDMKKLIKYGQKMREYARRHENENVKLRLMLDEVQAENERLKKQIEALRGGDAGETERMLRITKEYDTRNDTLRAPGRLSEAKGDAAMRRISTFDLINLDCLPAIPPTSKQTSASHTERSLGDDHRPHNADASRDLKQEKRSISISGHSKHRKLSFVSPDSKPNPLLDPDCQTRQPPSRSISDNITTTAPTASGPAPNASRLAPDRLAAARARVKMKAELRRVSAETDVPEPAPPSARNDLERPAKQRDEYRQVVDGNGGPGYVATKNAKVAHITSKVETSLVDWAGL